MENDDTQVQDDTLQNETSEEETVEEETTESDEADAPDWEAEAKKWKAIAERNKKKAAEAPKKQTVAKQDTSPEVVEETVLRAQGMDEELLAHLKKVAKLNETTLLAAQADPLFQTFKAQHEEAKKVEQAQVGASKGSGNRQAPKDFTTPGLSKDEHKKMTQEALKNLRV